MEEKQTQEKSKLFGKLDVNMVYLLVVNILLISFIIFSMWGAFTFWQLGAEPPQNVTIHGMYSDIQFHESFKQSHNNISEVLLSQGFLAYTINCLVSDGVRGGLRLGVSTFSLTQAAIIVLILFDVWEIVKFLKSKKKVKTESET